MTVFTSDGRSYTGMTEQTIIGLRAELGLNKTVFVTKEQFDAIVPVPDNGGGGIPQVTVERKLDDLIATLQAKGII